MRQDQPQPRFLSSLSGLLQSLRTVRNPGPQAEQPQSPRQSDLRPSYRAANGSARSRASLEARSPAQMLIVQAISRALKQSGLTRFEVSNASSWPGTIPSSVCSRQRVSIFAAGDKSCPDTAMLSGNTPGKKSPGLGHSHRGLTQTCMRESPRCCQHPKQPLFLQEHRINLQIIWLKSREGKKKPKKIA